MSLERKKGLPEFPKGSLEGFPILHDRLGIGTVGGRSVCNGVPKLPHHQKLAFTRCVQALLGTVPVQKEGLLDLWRAEEGVPFGEASPQGREGECLAQVSIFLTIFPQIPSLLIS